MLGHADIIHHDSGSLIYIMLFSDEGPADCGEYGEAAGAGALNVIVATGTDARGECNTPKYTLARHSQLALARRREHRR